MLDNKNRLILGAELIEKVKLNVPQKMYIYYEPEKKRLALKSTDLLENMYFVKEQLVDIHCRIVIPASIRNAFPEATYLPVTTGGEIYILIIEHPKKSE